jgi:uncharacterized protein YndB with AHSA1/START domain
MSTARRSRTIAAQPQELWEVIGDPYHLPRWWPGVARVEGVTAEGWTQVHLTRKQKPVRLDFHVLSSEPPYHRLWEQQIEGTPFARVLLSSITEIALELEAAGTRVTIEQRQRTRGYSRTGAWQVKRATAKKLGEALDGLERILGEAS